MKSDSGKVLFFILFLTLSAMTVVAGTIKGTVTDKQTREPLTGATIQIAGTTQGTVADVDGNYSLDVNNGIYTLAIKYVGYKDIIINNVKAGKSDLILNFELESDAQALWQFLPARVRRKRRPPAARKAGRKGGYFPHFRRRPRRVRAGF